MMNERHELDKFHIVIYNIPQLYTYRMNFMKYLKIPKGYSDSVNRRTDDIMTKRKKGKQNKQ